MDTIYLRNRIANLTNSGVTDIILETYTLLMDDLEYTTEIDNLLSIDELDIDNNEFLDGIIILTKRGLINYIKGYGVLLDDIVMEFRLSDIFNLAYGLKSLAELDEIILDEVDAILNITDDNITNIDILYKLLSTIVPTNNFNFIYEVVIDISDKLFFGVRELVKAALDIDSVDYHDNINMDKLFYLINKILLLNDLPKRIKEIILDEHKVISIYNNIGVYKASFIKEIKFYLFETDNINSTINRFIAVIAIIAHLEKADNKFDYVVEELSKLVNTYNVDIIKSVLSTYDESGLFNYLTSVIYNYEGSDHE